MKIFKSYSDLFSAIKKGETSAEAYTRFLLSEIDSKKHLNCYLESFATEAIEQAKRADQKIKSGTAGKLAGMPIAIKDVINIKGQIASCGSKMLSEYRSVYHATVIDRLLAEDAILIGRTNMDEFAMGSSNENSAFGAVKNPVDESRVPGGSSGGSAVAVAADLAITSLGTDTGGSIRFPAAFCGIVGLKPTYGRVSRFGLVAFASSFDQIGPFSHTVEDAARILEVIGGLDPKDSTSSATPNEDFTQYLKQSIQGLKIGLPDEYFGEGLLPEIKDRVLTVAENLKKMGATLVPVKLPHTNYCIATYYILTTAEASSNLARYDGVRYTIRTKDAATLSELYVKTRTEGFGAEVKRRIMLGTYVLSSGYYDAYYTKAQKVRRLIRDDFMNAFSTVDVILGPTSPSLPFKLGEKTANPLEMYLSDIYTVSANLAGIPGISVPAGKAQNGLPIGVQLLGKHFDEATLLRVASHIETMTY